MPTTTRNNYRPGFTLVELLVVIAIIGLLAGLILPAVMGAVKTARQAAYKLEVDTLSEAVEKYRSKYGDYPPDGSSWAIMERHIRKAFPQILQSEINLLNPTDSTLLATQGWNGNPWAVRTNWVAGIRNDFDTDVTTSTYATSSLKVMDPAEALVFFLGGFSSDPQRPFTGTGGPFLPIPGAAAGSQQYSYNLQRSGSFFEFQTGRLSVLQDTSGFTISNDETLYFDSPNSRDLLPVYVGSNGTVGIDAPLVYFDGRNYTSFKKAAVSGDPDIAYVSFYQPSLLATVSTDAKARLGAVRPVVSNTIRSSAKAIPFPRNIFMEEGKFQVLGAGVDGSYGGLLASEVSPLLSDADHLAAAIFVALPTGDSYQSNATRVPGNPFPYWYSRMILISTSPMSNEMKSRSLSILDNAANFSGRTFQESVAIGSL